VLVATYATPSHVPMAKRFVLDRMELAGFCGSVVWFEEEQQCESATFKRTGWNAATSRKYRWLASLPEEDRPILFVDADVALFPGLAAWCERCLDDRFPGWIGHGDDIVQLCTGVLLFRSTREVLQWFDFCSKFCELIEENDQDGLHILKTNAKAMPVQCETLPGNRVTNWATLGHMHPWQGEPIDVPDTTLAWHANWCVGVEAKTRMLTEVTSGKL
jgi:hypothetical protein